MTRVVAAILIYSCIAGVATGQTRDPEPLMPELLDQARAGSPQARVAAVIALSRIRDVQSIRDYALVDVLGALAGDADAVPRLRCEAANALIVLASVDRSLRLRALDRLAPLLVNNQVPTSVRCAIARDIWKVMESSRGGLDRLALENLLKVARTSGRPLAVAATRALSHFWGDEVKGFWREVLRSSRSDPVLFHTCLVLLGDRLTPQTFDSRTSDLLRLRLVRNLEDKDASDEERAQALLGLVRLNVRTARRHALAVAAAPHDHSTAMVGAAIEGVGVIGTPDAVAVLQSAYHKATKPDQAPLRAAAVGALGRLIPGLKASSSALGEIEKTLTHALSHDGNIPVVRQAAFWLGALGPHKPASKAAVEALIAALADPDEQVRQHCRASLEILTLQRLPTRPHEPPSVEQVRWRQWLMDAR